ncbi:putative Alpha-galactosidase [Glarea lozoyensis 74030]|uniref:alpha-galactosidase n=1 Tax=Glarea lozoyensis (strain ATCC 74030 / MF5533) TaxID=1104152 RepID=H0EWR2_GLAL7|nr:putative Alpha-galactosidase [Glarea lozoyensis 74030]
MFRSGSFVIAVAGSALFAIGVRGKDNGLAITPQMGYTTKFPRGMAAVADDIHALNLGFGMYSDAGRYTCGMYEGSLGHETVDANSFAEWGVDYLKYDNCYNEGYAGNQLISSTRYRTMGDALNATGRPILYSLCNWGEDYPWNWGSTVANSWRISGDIFDDWDAYDARCPCEGPDAWNCELPGFHCSVTNIFNKVAFIVSKAQPGAWNDLDMLEVGNGAMTDPEYVAHFSMWSAVKSPLIMGNDLRDIAPQDLSILSNAAVIAVNQDPLGQSAARRWLCHGNGTNGESGGSGIQLWSGNLKGTVHEDYNDYVVLLVNGNNNATVMNATLEDIFVDSGPRGHAPQVDMSWEVRDLWAGRMSNETAQAIIDASAVASNTTNGYNATTITSGGNATAIFDNRYNATAMSYADGLAANNSILLGSVTTTVQPSGTLTANVDRHGAAMFRLRAIPTAVRKRDEL